MDVITWKESVKLEKFELLNKSNIHNLQELIENDNMVFDINNLNIFIATDGAYGFVYLIDDKPVGLAYCCRLTRLDGLQEMYLHSIDILPEYQNNGYGTKFLQSILHYAKENSFCNLFLCSSQSLLNARHIYEKCGGTRDCVDEIIFNYDLT